MTAASEDKTFPLQITPVFRDRDELPTADDLGDALLNALQDSKHLIVVCSQHAAESKWVNEEVRVFKQLGREQRIHAVVVPNQPAGAVDRCFPPALRYRLTDAGKVSNDEVDILFADARPQSDGKHDAVLKVIAGILEVGFDKLKQRELVRRQRRLVALSAVSLVLILAMAGLTTWALLAQSAADAQRGVAEAEWKRAEVEKVEKERQRATARLRQIAAERRLADALVAQGRIRGSEGRWAEAKDLYSNAGRLYGSLGETGLPAKVGYRLSEQNSPDASIHFDGHDAQVASIHLSHDASRIVTGSKNGEVNVWLLRDAALLTKGPRHKTAIVAAGFVDDATVISLSEDGVAIRWRADSGDRIDSRRTGPGNKVTAATLSSDGGRLFFVSADYPADDVVIDGNVAKKVPSSVEALETDTLMQTQIASFKSIVYAIDCSPNGSELLLGIPDRTLHIQIDPLKLLNGMSGKIGVTGHPLIGWYPVLAVSFDQSGATAAVGCADGVLEVWDLSDGQQQLSTKEHVSGIRAVCFNGSSAIYGCGDGSIRRKAKTSHLFGGEGPVTVLHKPPGVETVLAGYADGSIHVWKSQDAPQVRKTQPDGMYASLHYSEDGSLIAATEILSTSVDIRDGSDGSLLRRVEFGREIEQAVLYGPDAVVACGEDGLLTSRDLITGHVIHDYPGHSGTVSACCIHQRAGILYSASKAAALLVHDCASGQVIREVEADAEIRELAVSDTGTCVVVGGGRLGLLPETGREIQWITAHAALASVSSLAITDDWIATGHRDSNVRIWSREDGRLHRTLKGHVNTVTGIQFTLSRRHLFSCGYGGYIKLWQVADGMELASFGRMPAMCMAMSQNGSIATGVMGDRELYGNVSLVIRDFGSAAQANSGATRTLGESERIAAAKELLRQKRWKDAAGEFSSIANSSVASPAAVAARLWLYSFTLSPVRLVEASETGDATLVEFMLDSGADVNSVDEYSEESALHAAVKQGHAAVVEILIGRGADVDFSVNGRGTPLSIAISRENLAMAKLLIENTANIHTVDRDGRNLLHVSAFRGNPKVIRFLLDLGVDKTTRDSDGETPFDHAESRSESQVSPGDKDWEPVLELLRSGNKID